MKTGITKSKKTAISVDDMVIYEADTAALGIGYSLRALFSKTMKEFLQSKRRASVTAYLNQVFGEESSQDELGFGQKFNSKLKAAESAP